MAMSRGFFPKRLALLTSAPFFKSNLIISFSFSLSGQLQALRTTLISGVSPPSKALISACFDKRSSSFFSVRSLDIIDINNSSVARLA